MTTKPTTVLLSLATLTAMFAAPAAFAEDPNQGANAPDLAPTAPEAGHEDLPAGVLIYGDDFGPQTARQAADNLLLPHEFITDPCDLSDAAQDGAHHLIVVNSIGSILSSCDDEVFSNLAAFAEGDGFLVLQSWELDICGQDEIVPWDVPCSAASVDEVLAALGVARPFTTHFEPVTLQATETVAACGVAPNPFVPTVDAIEPTSTAFQRNAQGVQADGATTCFTSASTGEGQVLVNGNGAYVGVSPSNYEDGASTTLPGPDDMVKLYEDLLVRFA